MGQGGAEGFFRTGCPFLLHPWRARREALVAHQAGLRCPPGAWPEAGPDTQDLGRRWRVGVQACQELAPPSSSPGHVGRDRESLPSEGPGVWCTGSHFALVRVDSHMRGQLPRHLGEPWAWPASLATGKGFQNSALLCTSIPLPHHREEDTMGVVGQLSTLE